MVSFPVGASASGFLAALACERRERPPLGFGADLGSEAVDTDSRELDEETDSKDEDDAEADEEEDLPPERRERMALGLAGD